MKLLLDENLSRRLAPLLQSIFPNSSHVSLVGLERADDSAVWSFAKSNGFVIVSKDDDFHAMNVLHGHPPRLIRLRMGNCSNQAVLDALSNGAAKIEQTFGDSDIGSVDLY